MNLSEIHRILSNVPPLPWHVIPGDNFDHWQLWSSDHKHGCSMIQDDAGVEPSPEFLEYLVKSREIIEYLLSKLDKSSL